MNWPVLKDKKWWVFTIASFTLSIIAIILAIVDVDNVYWVTVLILTQFINFFSMKRASYLTHEVQGKNECIE